eukprot:62390_1
MSGLSPHIASIISSPARRLQQVDTVSLQSGATFERTGSKWGGYIALIGGSLMQLTFGSLFCFGNLVPYIASYMTYSDYIESHPNQDFDIATSYENYTTQTNWVLFIMVTCMSIFIVFGGDLEVRIGPTKTYIISALSVTLGVGLSYFSLTYNSNGLLIVTYGVIFGCGVGIGYPVLVIVCMRWFPKHRGAVCGIISAIYGSGAFVFDSIQTALVNPDNVSINPSTGYVLQNDVIQRIPFMFAYIAAIMLTMQIIAIACVRSPPWFRSQNQIIDANMAENVSKSQLQYEAFSLTLKQTMTLWVFWELWINNFLYCIVLMFVTSEWKVFGSNYLEIQNDQLLSLIGSVSSLFNGVGRFCWGIFYDRNQSFRISMGLQTAIITVFIATLPLIKLITENESIVNTLFAVWLFIIWSCVGCEYAFLPSCIVETFGAKYCGSIVGVFVGGEAPATAIIVLSSKYVFHNNDRDWQYYCIAMALCTTVSTILSILYKPGRINRKEYLKCNNQKIKSYDSININQ